MCVISPSGKFLEEKGKGKFLGELTWYSNNSDAKEKLVLFTNTTTTQKVRDFALRTRLVVIGNTRRSWCPCCWDHPITGLLQLSLLGHFCWSQMKDLNWLYEKSFCASMRRQLSEEEGILLHLKLVRVTIYSWIAVKNLDDNVTARSSGSSGLQID